MGIYDCVGDIQIKCTPDPKMKDYKLKDKIELEDGAYIGYEGLFIVKKQRIVAITDKLFDKYGVDLNISDIVNRNNPVYNAIKDLGIEEDGKFKRHKK